MKEAYFCCYPWDLEDEGLEKSLARLSGEIGVNAISIAAATGPIHELRPRFPFDSRVFRSPAGVNFQPLAKCYAGIQIKPATASWMKTRNPIAKICELASEERLAVRGRLSCCESDSLAHRHPHAACVNIFGESSLSRLCPSHPEVREYLGALVEDLSTQYPVDTIELDEAGFGRAWPWYTQASLVPTEALATLIQWCFCAACRQRAMDAGIDAQSAANALQDRLARSHTAAGSDGESIDDLVGGHPALQRYQSFREEVVTSLIKMLRLRAKKRLVLQAGGPRLLTGLHVKACLEHCDAVVFESAGSKPASQSEMVARSFGPEKWEAVFVCHPPAASDSASLVAAVHACVRNGCEHVGFSNYGIVSSDNLDWVRQAIRYARREG